MPTTDSLVRLKRSNVKGKEPQKSDIEYGELAINTYDGNIYIKRNGDFGEEIVNLPGNPTVTVFGRNVDTVIGVE